MYHAYSYIFAPGTTQPKRNLCDEESNKYLSKLGGQIGAQLQLVGGGGEQRNWSGVEGDLTMSVAFQKNNLPQLCHVSSPRRGQIRPFSLPLSASPLMPLNQPGGDIIIILGPGRLVLVVYCTSVFTCTCVLSVCVCVRVSQGPSGHNISV
ncbi:hypothetical protein CHARACLAT_005110 [Characodon lateralis]|uniref:Uncharacterized protein n=1 Tax=Characodon lateralis TaxID=208331 RepID=A0ABU7EGR0_9TELE|nr:hypothetical protein [Characodon lateralis]